MNTKDRTELILSTIRAGGIYTVSKGVTRFFEDTGILEVFTEHDILNREHISALMVIPEFTWTEVNNNRMLLVFSLKEKEDAETNQEQ